MEGIVYTIKHAYSGDQVNVATWDAGLKLDSMKCCGLAEFGTAQSGNGLEYAFVVFRGAGEIKWRGEIWRSVPKYIVSTATSLTLVGWGDPLLNYYFMSRPASISMGLVDLVSKINNAARRVVDPGSFQFSISSISTGCLQAGVPDVSCAGNINMGPDAVYFANTDASPRTDVSDLVELMSR